MRDVTPIGFKFIGPSMDLPRMHVQGGLLPIVNGVITPTSRGYNPIYTCTRQIIGVPQPYL